MSSDKRQQLSLFGDHETAAQKAKRYPFEPEIPLFPEAVDDLAAPILELQLETAAVVLPKPTPALGGADPAATASHLPLTAAPMAERPLIPSSHANAAPLAPSDYQELAQVITRAQGGLANRSGRVLESSVISLFTQHGFQAVPHRLYSKEPESYGTELLLTDVPYTSIYGHAGKTEFLVRSQRLRLETRIECKWQQSSGSVDEKFPYLYLNCIFAMPEDHIIVVVDGGGAKPAAVTWLKQAATTRHLIPADKAGKRIDVHTLSEFMIWANRALR